MPFRQEWFPAPADETIIIHKEKPKGLYYYCKYCEGWIEGSPNRYREDNMGMLCGRRGTVEYCRRCGEEIGFFGVMS